MLADGAWKLVRFGASSVRPCACTLLLVELGSEGREPQDRVDDRSEVTDSPEVGEALRVLVMFVFLIFLCPVGGVEGVRIESVSAKPISVGRALVDAISC